MSRGSGKTRRCQGTKRRTCRQTNLQHQQLRERKNLVARQPRRKPGARRPRKHGLWAIPCCSVHLGLEHPLQARPRLQRRGQQLAVQLRHGRCVQRRIARVRLQELDQRQQLGRPRRLQKKKKNNGKKGEKMKEMNKIERQGHTSGVGTHRHRSIRIRHRRHTISAQPNDTLRYRWARSM